MSSSTDFWAEIRLCLDRIEIEKPNTFEGVKAIVQAHGNPGKIDNPALFFDGGGGDDRMVDALRLAGWKVVQAEAWYFFTAVHPETGAGVEYIEGDMYPHPR